MRGKLGNPRWRERSATPSPVMKGGLCAGERTYPAPLSRTPVTACSRRLRQYDEDADMANTSYLRYTVEPWVREQLAERYARPFAARVLGLAPGGTHEFDAVSDDWQIVASIKANSGLTSGGNHPTARSPHA